MTEDSEKGIHGMKVLIQNGHVLDPVTSRNGVYDVLVEDDKIVKVEKGITAEADKVICMCISGIRDWNTKRH